MSFIVYSYFETHCLPAFCLTGRGGGSKTDLFYLDNEAISRRIAGHRYPVWTGIGHETDTSILDHVANRHFKTPTAVGEEIVARFVELKRHLEEAENRFRSSWSYRFDKDRTWDSSGNREIHPWQRNRHMKNWSKE